MRYIANIYYTIINLLQICFYLDKNIWRPSYQGICLQIWQGDTRDRKLRDRGLQMREQKLRDVLQRDSVRVQNVLTYPSSSFVLGIIEVYVQSYLLIYIYIYTIYIDILGHLKHFVKTWKSRNALSCIKISISKQQAKGYDSNEIQ